MVQGIRIMHCCIYIIIFSMTYIFVLKRNIYHKESSYFYDNIRDLQYQLFLFLILYNFLYYNHFIKKKQYVFCDKESRYCILRNFYNYRMSIWLVRKDCCVYYMAHSSLDGAQPARYRERCRATLWGIRVSSHKTR